MVFRRLKNLLKNRCSQGYKHTVLKHANNHSNPVYQFYSRNLLTILVKSAIIYEKGVRYERIRL